MIKHKIGNLLEAKDVDGILHCANLFHTFGAGIARQIALKYPEALEADKKTPHGDAVKLGTYSIAQTWDGKFVVNLYAMFGMGRGQRQTSYDALVTALEKLVKTYEFNGTRLKIGIPYKMGADLAGGDFNIILAILESVFKDTGIDVIVYYLPQFANECPRPEKECPRKTDWAEQDLGSDGF